MSSFFIVSYESVSRLFQPGEGPRRGLLRDCTTSPNNRFAALVPALQHRPHRGHRLQRDRQEGDVGEDVSVGDEDVADRLGEDESSDALLVDGEDLHHDGVQNVAP